MHNNTILQMLKHAKNTIKEPTQVKVEVPLILKGKLIKKPIKSKLLFGGF